jgi:anti-sigma regulatory factor (Ser/Thr protein kinase)
MQCGFDVTMPGETAAMSEPRLILRSRLDELAVLWAWVESLAAEHAIPADTQFAIQLCLEEALSNIIRHGYREEPDHSIRVEFSAGGGQVTFVIEDQAPPFNPLAPDSTRELPVPSSIDQIPLGGRGISLMRKFAGSLAYERLAGGNSLTMRFPAHK